jgi:hypothetical protein
MYEYCGVRHRSVLHQSSAVLCCNAASCLKLDPDVGVGLQPLHSSLFCLLLRTHLCVRIHLLLVAAAQCDFSTTQTQHHHQPRFPLAQTRHICVFGLPCGYHLTRPVTYQHLRRLQLEFGVGPLPFLDLSGCVVLETSNWFILRHRRRPQLGRSIPTTRHHYHSSPTAHRPFPLSSIRPAILRLQPPSPSPPPHILT